MELEASSPRIFVNNKAKNQVDVVDREKRTIVARWPVPKCKTNVSMAFDEENHRLFVACRTGNISVLDTESGKKITALPITKRVFNDLYESSTKRMYTT